MDSLRSLNKLLLCTSNLTGCSPRESHQPNPPAIRQRLELLITLLLPGLDRLMLQRQAPETSTH